MAIVDEVKDWSYNNILNNHTNNNIEDRKDTETKSGLQTVSLATPYVDIGTMDIQRIVNAKTYTLADKVYYANMSKEGSIYIRKRNSNVYSISPIMNIHSFSKDEIAPPEQLLIIEECTFGDSKAALDTLHLMDLSRSEVDDDVYMKDREFICNDLRQVVKTLSTRTPATYNHDSPVTLRFTRYIPLRDIREKGIIHSVNLDVTISLDRRMCLDPFPGRVTDIDKVAEGNGYKLSVEIVDNDDLVSNKYMKGIKGVIRIPITKNPILPNTLRIEESIDNEVVNTIISDLSIESLNNHNIFSSVEEANVSGDLKTKKLVADYEEAIRRYKEIVASQEETIKELKAELSGKILHQKILEDTAEDVEVVEEDWKSSLAKSLESLTKISGMVTKTDSVIKVLSKYKK